MYGLDEGKLIYEIRCKIASKLSKLQPYGIILMCAKCLVFCTKTHENFTMTTEETRIVTILESQLDLILEQNGLSELGIQAAEFSYLRWEKLQNISLNWTSNNCIEVTKVAEVK